MNQDFVVYIVLAVTIGIVLLSFIKNLRKSQSASGCCSGCTGCQISKNQQACNKIKQLR